LIKKNYFFKTLDFFDQISIYKKNILYGCQNWKQKVTSIFGSLNNSLFFACVKVLWFLIKNFRKHFRTAIIKSLLFFSQHVGYDARSSLALRPEDWMGSSGIQPQPQSGLGGRGLRILQSSGHATNLTQKWRHQKRRYLFEELP